MKRLIFITLALASLGTKAQFWIPNDFAVDFSESIRVQDSTYLNGSKIKLETMPARDNTQGRIIVVDSSDNMINYRDVSTITSATDLSFSGASSPVTLNSSTGTDVTITAGGINTFSQAGNNLTITGTEVDGSVSNEIQNLSYDAVNHEVDISLGGTSATIPLALDDGATEGLASFTAADFDVTAGNVALDYTTLGGVYLKLDQTTPQTVSSGAPNFSGGINVNNNFAINTSGKISESGNSTPALGQILVGDGVDMELTFDPRNLWPIYGTFHGSEFDGSTSSISGAWNVMTPAVSGAGSNVVINAYNSTSGAAGLFTGTNAAGYASLKASGTSTSNQTMLISQGVMVFETRVYFPDSATATQDYALTAGFKTLTTLDGNNGFFFKYNRAVSGHFWVATEAELGVITNTVTAVAATEDTWYTLRVEVDYSQRQAKYYINGTLVHTETIGITVDYTYTQLQIIKQGGTTDRAAYFDYYWAWQRWYTPQTNRGSFSSISGY